MTTQLKNHSHRRVVTFSTFCPFLSGPIARAESDGINVFRRDFTRLDVFHDFPASVKRRLRFIRGSKVYYTMTAKFPDHTENNPCVVLSDFQIYVGKEAK